MSRKPLLALSMIALLAVGCSSESPMQTSDDNSVDAALVANDARGTATDAAASWHGRGHRGHNRNRTNMVTFEVRIEDVSTTSTLMLSNGETAPAPVSPGVWAVTDDGNPFFTVGEVQPGIGLEAQAEDGDPTMLSGNITSLEDVMSSGVFSIPEGDDMPGPALPGNSFVFTFDAAPGDRLSFTSMFGQSNDLFYSPGAEGINLFFCNRWPIRGDITRYIYLWDAGTEVNQEPGLGPDQAPRQSGPNTGASESMPVNLVNDEFTYPDTREVIKVTITPLRSCGAGYASH